MTAAPHPDRPHRLTKPFFTFGTLTLLLLMGIGYAFGVTRLVLGLGSVTNLDDHNPWGIWISFDVACGVALAAGGFTTAALVDIFGKKKYKPLLRPAILTAFLGYLWVAIALAFDLGRYWNIWRPIFNWQGNSVLFEVGMCVTFYLMVLGVEMSPPILEGLRERIKGQEWGAGFLRLFERPIVALHKAVKIVLPIFIITGVCLSFMHQSSLGTLMLIAHTKLNPLWDTPIMPLLFLMSAIMVGFPMVILESIYANISFGRDPEMELLTPLSRFVPWFIGSYGALKIGDLIVRRSQLDLLAEPAATVSLVVEILLGVVAPFLLFMNRSVRRSVGWLFFSVSLVIFGVVLNRINVFLVAYNPPFATKGYFPSVGEIAMTVAIVSSIMFCYRFFVTFFPILPGYTPSSNGHAAASPTPEPEDGEHSVSPFWTWITRGAAVAILIGFAALYTVVHTEALEANVATVEEVKRVKAEVARPEPPGPRPTYPQRPSTYKNFYVMASPALNGRADDYEPVKFAHRIHDELTGGDCGVCHHRASLAEGDRIGEDLKVLHAAMDINLGGPCASCHDDMAKMPPQSCGSCHDRSNEADAPDRLGLKGAYHRQCIGCHEHQPEPGTAPTDCAGCHHPWTPDHGPLVALKASPTPQDVTRACLGCHPKVGQELLRTAHWSWQGTSSALVGYEHRRDISLKLMVNNYCISIGSNLQQCASCHIGYGGVRAGFDFSNPENIDCLVCHDTTGTYRKDPTKGGMPAPSVDLVAVARKVGRTSRQACGSCHFESGGGPNAKHGDLEPAMAEAGTDLDMHMGTLDLRCQDCHTTTDHRIAGLSMTAPAVEGRVTCEKCHGVTPHGVTGVLSRHIDDHVRTVACETCHIPTFARRSPTITRRDYSTAGQDRPESQGALGMPEYDKRFGTLAWGKDLVPTYRWWDGKRHAVLVGDKINPARAPIGLNTPVGERRNPTARIFPFKLHTARQPYDTEHRTLALPNFLEDYWVSFDWPKALADGMAQVGLPFSGKYDFVETEMYSAIHHGVVPAKRALGCADCHSAEAVTCPRCHKNAEGMALPEHWTAVYPEVEGRLDFTALGYPDDPARVGGRFFLRLGRGAPQQ